MHYKTIVLQLLEQHPELYSQLRNRRQLLPALDIYSDQLKTLHEEEKEVLSQAKPDSDPIQINSEALEIALKAFEDRLPTNTQADETQALSLDQAMAFVRSHSSRD
jgi:hypothetical protein